MRLFEIIHDSDIYKEIKKLHFKNTVTPKKKVGIIDKHNIYLFKEGDEIEILLTDFKDKVVGVLDLKLYKYGKTNKVYEVGGVELLPTAQGKNLGYKLYAFLITEMNMTIISGKSHSPGSQKMYMKLAKHPNITAYGMGWDDEKDKGIYTQLSPDEIYARLTGDLFDVYDDDEYGEYFDNIKDNIKNIQTQIKRIDNQLNKTNTTNEKKQKLKKKKNGLNKYIKYLEKTLSKVRNVPKIYDTRIVLTKKIK